VWEEQGREKVFLSERKGRGTSFEILEGEKGAFEKSERKPALHEKRKGGIGWAGYLLRREEKGAVPYMINRTGARKKCILVARQK